jgi:hypothetical protein
MMWTLGQRAMRPGFIVMALGMAAVCAPPAAAQIGGRGIRPKVERPTGETWDVIRKNCTLCHGIDDYAFFALDRAGWQNLIETKHKSMGVTLSDADRGLLLDWLVGKFGPQTKPFPRSYIPAEITTFFTDPEAKRLLTRACTTCHEMSRVEQARHPMDEWRVLVVDMRERGAQISDDEVEHLVEWLGRVWGTNQDK